MGNQDNLDIMRKEKNKILQWTTRDRLTEKNQFYAISAGNEPAHLSKLFIGIMDGAPNEVLPQKYK